MDTKIFLSPIQDRFLSYSLRVVSPLRKHPDELTPFRFIECVYLVNQHRQNWRGISLIHPPKVLGKEITKGRAESTACR